MQINTSYKVESDNSLKYSPAVPLASFRFLSPVNSLIIGGVLMVVVNNLKFTTQSLTCLTLPLKTTVMRLLFLNMRIFISKWNVGQSW